MKSFATSGAFDTISIFLCGMCPLGTKHTIVRPCKKGIKQCQTHYIVDTIHTLHLSKKKIDIGLSRTIAVSKHSKIIALIKLKASAIIRKKKKIGQYYC